MLSDEDKRCIRQWMLDSLDGSGILEDGDLPAVDAVCNGGPCHFNLDDVREAISRYGREVINGCQ